MAQGDATTAAVLDVLIVGAGFAGLGMAIRLREAGENNFLVLEKADDVGGTWRENTYPGCACDVMSMMYSYSFAPSTDWSRLYAGQPEILDYIRRVAKHYELRRHIRFRSEVVSYDFEDDADRWRVRTADGAEYLARVVVAAHGALHRPNIPDFPGRSEFTGPVFHSARWDHDVDLTGKRVAVIGTGASSAQFVPEIVQRAERVTVFQRNAHWVLPKPDRPVSTREHKLFKAFPAAMKIYRNIAFWTHEVPVAGFLHPRLLFLLKWASMRNLRRQVPDPGLRAKLTPSYTIGCKRILLSSDFYPALQQPNAALVTAPIEQFAAGGIRTADGEFHAADVVILGTGFDTENRCASEHIVGRDGITIQEAWRDGMQAYLGMTVTGFPNFFMIMGPNSGGGSQSILFVIETQIRYITRCLRLMRSRGTTRFEVRESVQRDFNDRLHGKLAGSVWNSGGCHSWFLDHTGRNRQSWPGTGTSYWFATRRVEEDAFLTAPLVTAQAVR
ncbi:flavin-containing monooxygenase [Nocardia aurantia]|uniref:Baeyer-Villiger monooxygenase n=1 Tax=Nocardia aurantia TaxID=2585199 RepID=A0A7K0DKV8_9NOCA|nr:NAD(P)/FAD-dependent oxidoreductase [Nocardia aurantia]MQY26413.1 Baeyer-Villiger monooxygenase [Nocardia aurantia]